MASGRVSSTGLVLAISLIHAKTCISGDEMTVFGPDNKNKALCACGSISDLDSRSVNTKRRLGKRVECMACRNKRIAQEHEDLERHFQGPDDEGID